MPKRTSVANDGAKYTTMTERLRAFDEAADFVESYEVKRTATGRSYLAKRSTDIQDPSAIVIARCLRQMGRGTMNSLGHSPMSEEEPRFEVNHGASALDATYVAAKSSVKYNPRKFAPKAE